MDSRKDSLIQTAANSEKIIFDDIELDRSSFQLRKAGEVVHTEPLVFDFITYIVRNRDRVVSREELINELWQGRSVSDATVAGCIKSARKALGDSGERQAYIKTVRGRGVQFVGSMEAAKTMPTCDASSKSAGTTPSSLVVLPFEVFGERGELDSLADGLVENLTTVLTRVPLLSVVSRTSSFALKGQTLDAKEVAGRLGVKYLLEGSVQMLDGRVRVNVQLIDAPSDFHIWAQQFEQAADGSAIEGLLRQILPRLEPRLSQAIYKDLGGLADEAAAGQLLLKATSLLSTKGWHQTTFSEAAELLRTAVKRESDLALGHAYLALVLGLGHRVGLLDRSGAIAAEAVQQAERALALDSLDSNVVGVAACAIADAGQADRAEPLLKKALDLNPDNGQAWTALGSTYALLGKSEQAIEALRRGISISPMDSRLAVWRAVLAIVLLQTGALDEARLEAELACQSDDKNYLPRVALAAARAVGQDMDGASRAIKDAQRTKPDLTQTEIGHLTGRKVGEVLGGLL